jgi:thiol-disulfide isomerase/thioredoxin
MKRLTSLLLTTALLATSVCVASEATPAVAKPAIPQLKVETLKHGEFDLADHRGSWVVVNFWATWCAPCLKEIPDLGEFDASRDDVKLIGLAYEEIEVDDMLAFIIKHKIAYPIAIIDTYAPPGDFDTPRGLPMTYLIDPAGAVTKRYLGPVTSSELAAAMAASEVSASGG